MPIMDISFDSGRPIYKQIVEQVLVKIKKGELKPGDKLPTEREMAEKLCIARGTVKKAYKELADNNITEVIHGSGNYIYSDSDSYNLERRRLALQLIEDTLDRLEGWELSEKEISALLRMTMAKRDASQRAARVAVIDCNPESLSLFKRQLSYIPGITVTLILVDTILLSDRPAQLLEEFDIVLTTATHYEQIMLGVGETGIKILPVDMAPARQTVVSVSTLPEGTSVGIICQSNKYAHLIIEQLELFTGLKRTVPVHFETDIRGSIKFMKRFGAVITSPGLLLLDTKLSGGAAEAYSAAGGRIIPFDYHIGRASLIQVEEQVDRVISGKSQGL